MPVIRASERLGSVSDAVIDPTRPSDWLPMPAVVDGDQVVHVLVAVWNHDSNFIAIECQGNYSINWGNGTVVDYASNTVAEYQFAWADYPASSVTTNGYRQALVTITPQAGHNLTQINVAKLHSNLSGFTQSNDVLEVVSAGSFLDFVKCKDITRPRFLRKYKHVGVCNFTSMLDMFSDASSLKSVAGIDLSQSTNFTRPFSYSAIEHIDSNVVNLQNVADFTQAFRDCNNLRHFSANMSSAANTNLMFLNTRSLSSVDMTGLKVSISFDGCSLSAAALNKIFSDLVDLTANSLPAATITITGNHGAASCDPSIATAKGWTVTI